MITGGVVAPPTVPGASVISSTPTTSGQVGGAVIDVLATVSYLDQQTDGISVPSLDVEPLYPAEDLFPSEDLYPSDGSASVIGLTVIISQSIIGEAA